MLDTLKRFFNFIFGNKEKKPLTTEERMAKIKREAKLASLGRSESGHRKYRPHNSYNKSQNRSNKNRRNSDDDLNSMLYASILYNNYSDQNYDYSNDNDCDHTSEAEYDNGYEQGDYQYEDCNSDYDSGGYDSGDSGYDFDSGGCDFDSSND